MKMLKRKDGHLFPWTEEHAKQTERFSEVEYTGEDPATETEGAAPAAEDPNKKKK